MMSMPSARTCVAALPSCGRASARINRPSAATRSAGSSQRQCARRPRTDGAHRLHDRERKRRRSVAPPAARQERQQHEEQQRPRIMQLHAAPPPGRSNATNSRAGVDGRARHPRAPDGGARTSPGRLRRGTGRAATRCAGASCGVALRRLEELLGRHLRRAQAEARFEVLAHDRREAHVEFLVATLPRSDAPALQACASASRANLVRRARRHQHARPRRA